jgi:hypothetical protein
MRDSHVPIVLLVTLVACALDSSGLGTSAGSIGSAGTTTSAEGDGAGETSSETSASVEGASEVTTADVVTTETSPSDDTTSAAAETGDEGPDITTGADPCSMAPPFLLQLDASTATLTGSMALGGTLDGRTYAYGETVDAQTMASFAIDLPCSDEYIVWAEVYDAEPGPLDLPLFESDPADVFEVEIGGIVTEWRYGCQWDVFDTWGTFAVSASPDCILNDKVVMSLVAGQHTLSIKPREAGEHTGGLTPGSVAAFSRVYITNDLDSPP